MEKFSNIAQLKDSGLKVTGPRLKILDLFETHAEEHLSAEDVYRILLEEGVEIGVATIYRVPPRPHRLREMRRSNRISQSGNRSAARQNRRRKRLPHRRSRAVYVRRMRRMPNQNQTLISLYVDFSDGLGHFQPKAV